MLIRVSRESLRLRRVHWELWEVTEESSRQTMEHNGTIEARNGTGTVPDNNRKWILSCFKRPLCIPMVLISQAIYGSHFFFMISKTMVRNPQGAHPMPSPAMLK